MLTLDALGPVYWRYIITVHPTRGGDFTIEVAATSDGSATNMATDRACAMTPYRFHTSILCKEAI